ncbi:hypothetical protein BDV27DRAFT_13639 [Aspergillus caelatus]|uniref:DNA recombination and repair protein Rad51-like C-terminal domain-containing protein n=2 Tax=Aspergillus subgen. Circumdati TaxID=2720871 RepID=A0A5N6ZZ96_9EURO|nr:uncharacterized protein BDV27DRAFT_13639 [Aspergillus caelatus]KAE8362852.1 hypothetical protein BDV27DRAFT_13639 [Aspergillus caelatus]KAE8415156.1 hypothetical protein BDV36DRAFT_227640 [Aspergillus pseudocaelatus]
MISARQIYLGNWVTDLIQYILDHDASRTVLIICSTRDAFLKQLLAIARARSSETAESHPILTKTIGLLSDSNRIKVVYCPTLENLRAYLSVLPLSGDLMQGPVTEEQKTRKPLMAILDLVALHMQTSEFSAQGLSRTFANAVEAASREGMNLVLCECQDAASHDSNERGEVLWYTNVPLLNSSVRRGESAWLGRSVPVNRVAQRWFEFNESGRPAPDTMHI